MSFNELIRILEKNGWTMKRTGKSSLRVFIKNGKTLVITLSWRLGSAERNCRGYFETSRNQIETDSLQANRKGLHL